MAKLVTYVKNSVPVVGSIAIRREFAGLWSRASPFRRLRRNGRRARPKKDVSGLNASYLSYIPPYAYPSFLEIWGILIGKEKWDVFSIWRRSENTIHYPLPLPVGVVNKN